MFTRLLFLAVLTITVLSTHQHAEAAKASPNVVIFLCDDLGWGDLACYGHPRIKTPNLDQFATQSVRFTQCYSACGVCSPSRGQR